MDFVYTNNNGIVTFGGLSKGISDFTTQDRLLVNSGSNVAQVGSPLNDTVMYHVANNKYIWSKINTSTFNYIGSQRVGIPVFSNSNTGYISIISPPTNNYNVIKYIQSTNSYSFERIQPTNVITGYTSSNNSIPNIVYAINSDFKNIQAKQGVFRYTSSTNTLEFSKVYPIELFGINNSSLTGVTVVNGSSFSVVQLSNGILKATTSTGFSVGIPNTNQIISNYSNSTNNGLIFSINNTLQSIPQPVTSGIYTLRYESNRRYTLMRFQSAVGEDLLPSDINPGASPDKIQVTISKYNKFDFVDTSVGFFMCDSESNLFFTPFANTIVNYSSSFAGINYVSGSSIYSVNISDSTPDSLLMYSRQENSFIWSKSGVNLLQFSSSNIATKGILAGGQSDNSFYFLQTVTPDYNSFIIHNDSTGSLILKNLQPSDLFKSFANTSSAKVVFYANNDFNSVSSSNNYSLLGINSNTADINFIKLNAKYFNNDPTLISGKSQLVYKFSDDSIKGIEQPVNSGVYLLDYNNLTGEYSCKEFIPSNVINSFVNDSMTKIVSINSTGNFDTISLSNTNSVLVNTQPGVLEIVKLTPRVLHNTPVNNSIVTIGSTGDYFNYTPITQGVLIGNNNSSQFKFPSVSDFTGQSKNALMYSLENTFVFTNEFIEGDSILHYDSSQELLTLINPLNSSFIKSIVPSTLNITGINENTNQVIINAKNTFKALDTTVTGVLYYNSTNDTISWLPVINTINNLNTQLTSVIFYNSTSSTLSQLEYNSSTDGTVLHKTDDSISWKFINSADIGDTVAPGAKLVYSLGNNNVLQVSNVLNNGVNLIEYNSNENILSFATATATNLSPDLTDTSIPLVIYTLNDKLLSIPSGLPNTFLNFNYNDSTDESTLSFQYIYPQALNGVQTITSGILLINNNEFDTIVNNDGVLIYDSIESNYLFTSVLPNKYITGNSNLSGLLYCSAGSLDDTTKLLTTNVNGDYLITVGESGDTYAFNTFNNVVTNSLQPELLNASLTTGVNIIYSSNNTWAVTSTQTAPVSNVLNYSSTTSSIDFINIVSLVNNSNSNGVITVNSVNSTLENIVPIETKSVLTGSLDFGKITSEYLAGTVSAGTMIYINSNSTFTSFEQPVNNINFGFHYNSNNNEYTTVDLNNVSTFANVTEKSTPGALVSQNSESLVYLSANENTTLVNLNGTLQFNKLQPGVLNYSIDTSLDLIYKPLLTDSTNTYFNIVNFNDQGLFYYFNNKPFINNTAVPASIFSSAQVPSGALLTVDNDTNKSIQWTAGNTTTGVYTLSYNSTTANYTFEPLEISFTKIKPSQLTNSVNPSGNSLIYSSNDTWETITQETSSGGFLFSDYMFSGIYKGIKDFNSSETGVLINSNKDIVQQYTSTDNTVLIYNNNSIEFNKVDMNNINVVYHSTNESNVSLLLQMNSIVHSLEIPLESRSYLLTSKGSETVPSLDPLTPLNVVGTSETGIVYINDNTFAHLDFSQGVLKFDPVANSLNFNVLQPTDFFIDLPTDEEIIPIGKYYSSNDTNVFGYTPVQQGIYFSENGSETLFGTPPASLIVESGTTGGITYLSSNNTLVTTGTPAEGNNVIYYNSITNVVSLVPLSSDSIGSGSSMGKPTDIGMSSTNYQMLYNNFGNWEFYNLDQPGIITWSGVDFKTQGITDFITGFNSNFNSVLINNGTGVQQATSIDGSVLIKRSEGTLPIWTKLSLSDLDYKNNVNSSSPSIICTTSDSKFIQLTAPTLPGNYALNYNNSYFNFVDLSYQTLFGINSSVKNAIFVTAGDKKYTISVLSNSGVVTFNSSTSAFTVKTSLSVSDLNWGSTGAPTYSSMFYTDSSGVLVSLGVPNYRFNILEYSNGTYSMANITGSSLFNISSDSTAKIVYLKNNTWQTVSGENTSGILKFDSSTMIYTISKLAYSDINIAINSNKSGLLTVNSTNNSLEVTPFANGIVSASSSGLSIGIPTIAKLLQNGASTGVGIIYTNGSLLYGTGNVTNSGNYVLSYNSSALTFSLQKIDNNFGNLTLPVSNSNYILNYNNGVYSWVQPSDSVDTLNIPTIPGEYILRVNSGIPVSYEWISSDTVLNKLNLPLDSISSDPMNLVNKQFALGVTENGTYIWSSVKESIFDNIQPDQSGTALVSDSTGTSFKKIKVNILSEESNVPGNSLLLVNSNNNFVKNALVQSVTGILCYNSTSSSITQVSGSTGVLTSDYTFAKLGVNELDTLTESSTEFTKFVTITSNDKFNFVTIPSGISYYNSANNSINGITETQGLLSYSSGNYSFNKLGFDSQLLSIADISVQPSSQDSLIVKSGSIFNYIKDESLGYLHKGSTGYTFENIDYNSIGFTNGIAYIINNIQGQVVPVNNDTVLVYTESSYSFNKLTPVNLNFTNYQSNSDSIVITTSNSFKQIILPSNSNANYVLHVENNNYTLQSITKSLYFESSSETSQEFTNGFINLVDLFPDLDDYTINYSCKITFKLNVVCDSIVTLLNDYYASFILLGTTSEGSTLENVSIISSLSQYATGFANFLLTGVIIVKEPSFTINDTIIAHCNNNFELITDSTLAIANNFNSELIIEYFDS